jgi:Cu(I)/Ag(I) efflux system membrane fusion protein
MHTRADRRSLRWLLPVGILVVVAAYLLTTHRSSHRRQLAATAARRSGQEQASAGGMEGMPGKGGAPAASKAAPTKPEVSNVPGRVAVQIDPARQQLIGVTTAPVKRRKLDRVVRTVGLVRVDEELLSDIYSKVPGWIERLYANETGRMVRKGQPLLTIYSPDLVSTQQEYLVALRSRDRLAKSPFPEVSRSGQTLVQAARERLSLWDIPEKEIQRLEKTGQVRKTLTLYAPSTGYITQKQAVEGVQVSPGMPLFKLAGLSRVWVDAAIYENEATLVKVGQWAQLTLDAYPGKTFKGRVKYIYPTVEAATRTLTARFEFPNPGLALKPDMYANVLVLVPTAEALSVPETAVIDTGVSTVVFLKAGAGTFIPREVTVGPRAAGYYPVLAGLQAGEEVVTSANFLIDSEAQFRAAVEAMKAGAHAGHGG